MTRHLLRANLVALVGLAVIAGALTIFGHPALRQLYLTLGLFGTPLLSFGVVQLGSGILVASAPTRRIGAAILIPTWLIGGYALASSHPLLATLATLAIVVMPTVVLWTTPRFALTPALAVPPLGDAGGR